MFKIALLDLNHMTVGVHTNTVPLGIGLIAYYLENNVNEKLDIRLFKNPERFVKALDKWLPDVMGLAQYSWNSRLNLYMAKLLKKKNLNCYIVAGGPDLYLDKKGRYDYLKKNDFIDICVKYDGEIPFAKVIVRLLEGENIVDIRRSPGAGTYSIDNRTGQLFESREKDPRLDKLDVFGALYANGFFDRFLHEEFHPFLQTQRGCPFQCTYCHTGNAYCSQVIFQSLNFFAQDLDYLGKRFAGQHNVVLYMANTNFGLFKNDIEIAKVIRHTQDKYDWPKHININTAGKTDRVLEILSILKYRFPPIFSLQSLSPTVIDNINRKNLPIEDIVYFQKNAPAEISEKTTTELILNLPGETKESFIKGVSLVLNSGLQNIVIYTLMALKGTPISTPETAKKFEHEIRYRIVPRCFSKINDEKIFEIEEVVVGTKYMSFEDYLYLRELALTITAFCSSVEMFPLRKFCRENEIEIANLIFNIHDRISRFPELYSLYRDYINETEDELFHSRRALYDFFDIPENYNKLCSGRLGDNLLRKYKAIIISKYYLYCVELALSQLRSIAEKKFDKNMLEPILRDLKIYMQSRDIGHIFKENYKQKEPEIVTLNYDVPGWINGERNDRTLEDYNGSFNFSIVVTDYMIERLNDINRMNRNPELSLQILYRDGLIKDFWPKWIRENIE